MNPRFIEIVAGELNLDPDRVSGCAMLLDEGASIPFISRYRKEATGSLDEVAVTAIRDRLTELAELAARKQSILASLEKNGHLTDELKAEVEQAENMAVLEDIYLPYRPKRRTKATIAREKGLEPLALALMEQTGKNPEQEAAAFVDPEKQVESVEEALAGARHIISEIVNEHPEARADLRELFLKKGVIQSRVLEGKEEEGAKYRDYFDWSEPAAAAPSHRVLAMRRGEAEDILSLTMAPDEDEAVALLEERFVLGDGPDSLEVKAAVKDAYKRLLSRSMETELRLETKQKADARAIAVFGANLKELLLAPPLGPKRVMGIDPGFRTGCKVVCLDRQGKLLFHETIYPHTSDRKQMEAARAVEKWIQTFRVEAVAVGNGTAGRETESFLRSLDFMSQIPVLMVNESGASIYSASKIAREEFGELDLTVRGAVSIGRRLMDPLSELVKIDPKSIGVGQYQHDVDQTALKNALDDVVVSCVNGVGVDVNRASEKLLSYVSGLGPALAGNIVAHRNANGPFARRRDFKNVERLGPKAFEQCAGFLRIPDAPDPLDRSAVHPESYPVVETMAKDLGCTVSDLVESEQARSQIKISQYVTETTGMPTLLDIMEELARPGRDPRDAFELFSFSKEVHAISDLEQGMKLPGIVTNVTAFGAFVDIGVHQDGLVHISELADRFVKNPSEVVKVGQKVKVRVLHVDLERNRIGLSMRQAPGPEDAGNHSGYSQRQKPGGKKGGNAKTQKKKPPQTPFHNPFAEKFGKL